MAGRPRLYESAEELKKKIDEFFATTPKSELTVTGLALYLGFESRQSFYDYEKNEQYSYIIKRARLQVEAAYEMRLNSNGCTGAIFALKNMGWKDKTEVEQSGGLTITWNEERTYETK